MNAMEMETVACFFYIFVIIMMAKQNILTETAATTFVLFFPVKSFCVTILTAISWPLVFEERYVSVRFNISNMHSNPIERSQIVAVFDNHPATFRCAILTPLYPTLAFVSWNAATGALISMPFILCIGR